MINNELNSLNINNNNDDFILRTQTTNAKINNDKKLNETISNEHETQINESTNEDNKFDSSLAVSLKIPLSKSHSNSPLASPSIILETILETNPNDSTNQVKNVKKSNTPISTTINQTNTSMTTTNTTNTPIHQRSRNRTDSIKQFTERFRSFSNDLLRSIENAHDLIDLKNSNFSAATQSAAAHAAEQHHHNNYLYDYDTNYLSPVYTNSFRDKSSFKAKKLNTSNRTIESTESSLSLSKPTSTSDNKKLNDEINTTPEYVNYDADNDNDYNLVYQQKSNLNTQLSANNRTSNQTSTNLNDSNELVVNNSNNNNNLNKINSPRIKIFTRPIDEININDNNNNEKEKSFLNSNNRVFFENNLNSIDQNLNRSEQDSINKDTTKKRKSSSSKKGSDHVDFRTRKRYIFKNGSKKSIPDDIHISILEVFIYLWGVITFFADLISDIILSIEYFNNSRIWLASMTLMFVIVPNVTLSLFSLSWYIDKYYSEKELQEQKLKQQHNTDNDNTRNSTLPKSTCDSITFWIMTILFVIFQLDLVWKYIQGFIYTLKGWACRSLFHNLKWEKYYIEKQIKCDTDIGMLRLIDVFLDSGPQVLLQLYVITTQNLNELGSANIVVFTFKDFQTTSLEIKQLVSILSSLFSMGYALAGYHRCLRNQQFIFCLETNKPLPRPMRWISTIMQFLWYLFLIAPRVLSMAIFASTFRSWFFMIIFTHWLIMYFWILRLKTNYCITSQDVYSAREEIFEKFYDLVCSFIYVFVYFNLKAGPTRIRYLIYYLIFYSENILFCTCYFLFSKETNFTYKLTMLLIVVFGFWIAITFQVIYYLHCHPSHDIQLCVRKKAQFHFIHKETLKPAHFYDFSTSEDDMKEDKSTNLNPMKMGKTSETKNNVNMMPSAIDPKINEIQNENLLRIQPKNFNVDSTKTSSSCSSFANDTENLVSSAIILKSNSINQNCQANILNSKGSNSNPPNSKKNKRKKRFFTKNFTQFLNLYSSTDSNLTPQFNHNNTNSHRSKTEYLQLNSIRKENDEIEIKRTNSTAVINYQTPNINDTTILTFSEINSPLSAHSKGSNSSFSSFSSYMTNSSSLKLTKTVISRNLITSQNNMKQLISNSQSNNYLSKGCYDFSVENICPPIVNIDEIFLNDSDNENDKNREPYDNLLALNHINKPLIVVRSKSCSENGKKETFL